MAVAQHADSSVHATSASRQISDTTIGPPERFGHVPLRFVIDLGGYLPFISTHASLSSQLRNGTHVNLENALGLSPSTQTFNLGASWRISKHNFLAFDYFGFNRSATKTISDSIIWGANTYHVGSTLDVNNNIDYYGISYRYYILARTQLGAWPGHRNRRPACWQQYGYSGCGVGNGHRSR